MKSLRFLFAGIAYLVWLTLIACGGGPTASDSQAGTIKISIRAVSSSSSATARKTDGTNSSMLTITRARVVIEKIKFESSLQDTLDFKFRQPFVQDLAVGSGTHVIETVQVPFGSYKETEIEIDDLDPEDGAAYLENPALQGKSILIEGFLNNNPEDTFTFSSDLSEEQEREFEPPLILDANSPSTNVVLFVNMDGWFVDRNGNPLDPRSPNNKSLIESNIKASIEIFEDKDEDGKRDDD